MKKEPSEVKAASDFKTIKPLKDFKFVCNEFKYDLKKGISVEVHKRFLPNLKTEKVIK